VGVWSPAAPEFAGNHAEAQTTAKQIKPDLTLREIRRPVIRPPAERIVARNQQQAPVYAADQADCARSVVNF
jgi:hypothetical protein